MEIINKIALAEGLVEILKDAIKQYKSMLNTPAEQTPSLFEQEAPAEITGEQVEEFIRNEVINTPVEKPVENPTEEGKPAKPKKGNTHWSFEDDNRLRRMYKDGKTDEEIGAELGRSPHAIKIRRFNLRLVEREQRPKVE